MTKLRVLLAATACVALAALGAACGAAGEATQHASPAGSGTLTVSFAEEPLTLDPALAAETSASCILRLTHQTLLTYAGVGGEAGAELVPDLAAEVPTVANGGISEDCRVFTFRLRKGVRFAPPVNREVTARDVEFSIGRMLGEPLAPTVSQYANIAGARAFRDGTAASVAGLQVLGPHALRIRLEEPDAGFLHALTLTPAAVLPREWVGRWGDAVGRHPLGSGPYVVTSWSPGREIILSASPNAPAASRGAATSIRCVYTLGAGDAVLALQRGEVDLLGDATPQARLADLAKSREWRERLVQGPRLDLSYVYLNTLVAPFGDVRVRRAVSHAIDTAALQERLGGRASALNQILPAGMPGHEPGALSYAHDTERAQELLAAAGYPDGFSTTLHTHDAEPMSTIAESVKKDLAAVGITVDIVKMDRAAYWRMASRKSSRFGIGLADWTADSPDPAALIGALFAKPANSRANFSFYEDREVERLLAAAAREADPGTRLALCRRMQARIMRDAPVVPLFQTVHTSVRSATTTGVFIHPVWGLDLARYGKTAGR